MNDLKIRAEEWREKIMSWDRDRRKIDHKSTRDQIQEIMKNSQVENRSVELKALKAKLEEKKFFVERGQVDGITKEQYHSLIQDMEAALHQ